VPSNRALDRFRTSILYSGTAMTPTSSKSQSIVVVPKPAEVFVGALMFQQYAAEYLVAAAAVPVKATHSPVPYFLLSRAIELGLKCFLRAQRVPVRELKYRPLGHDLVGLHERAKVEGLSQVLVLSQQQVTVLADVNAYYGVKDFEYLPMFKAIKGFPGLPALASLRALATDIVSPMERVGIDATNTKGPLFV
jgi:hypothetical protein